MSRNDPVMAALCLKRNIKLFLLPSNSPELDAYVERAHLAHTEGFYEVTDSSSTIPQLTDKLPNWEKLHNTARPHQCLGYLTPQEYLECYSENRRKQVMCH